MPETSYPLTDRQAEVLAFILYFRAANQFSPTTREIAEHFGFLQTAAQNHIRALEKKGAITTQPGKARTIVPKI